MMPLGAYSPIPGAISTGMNRERRLALGGRGGDGLIHPPRGDVPFDRRGKEPKVYVMALVGTPFVKVGISQDILTRRRTLRGPLDLDIRHVRHTEGWDAASIIEQAAHHLLSDFHHRNEWFSASVETAVYAIHLAVLQREGAEVAR